jgi:hypothetical protein
VRSWTAWRNRAESTGGSASLNDSTDRSALRNTICRRQARARAVASPATAASDSGSSISSRTCSDSARPHRANPVAALKRTSAQGSSSKCNNAVCARSSPSTPSVKAAVARSASRDGEGGVSSGGDCVAASTVSSNPGTLLRLSAEVAPRFGRSLRTPSGGRRSRGHRARSRPRPAAGKGLRPPPTRPAPDRGNCAIGCVRVPGCRTPIRPATDGTTGGRVARRAADASFPVRAAFEPVPPRLESCRDPPAAIERPILRVGRRTVPTSQTGQSQSRTPRPSTGGARRAERSIEASRTTIRPLRPRRSPDADRLTCPVEDHRS